MSANEKKQKGRPLGRTNKRRGRKRTHPVLLQMYKERHTSYRKIQRLYKKLKRRESLGSSVELRTPIRKRNYCKKCRKTFSSTRSYNRHLQTSKHQRQLWIYRLEQDNKKYMGLQEQQSSLSESDIESSEEENNNKDEEQYYCQQCDKYFKTAQALGSHKSTSKVHRNVFNDGYQQTDSADSDKNSQNERPKDNVSTDDHVQYYCQQCDRYFKTAQALGGHKASSKAHKKESKDESISTGSANLDKDSRNNGANNNHDEDLEIAKILLSLRYGKIHN